MRVRLDTASTGDLMGRFASRAVTANMTVQNASPTLQFWEISRIVQILAHMQSFSQIGQVVPSERAVISQWEVSRPIGTECKLTFSKASLSGLV